MNLILREIKALGQDRYEVAFDDGSGAMERVVCRVFQHNGVQGLRMEPDLVMAGHPPRIDSREVVAAVLAYQISPATDSRHSNAGSKPSESPSRDSLVASLTGRA